jgi:hypothetical protein
LAFLIKISRDAAQYTLGLTVLTNALAPIVRQERQAHAKKDRDDLDEPSSEGCRFRFKRGQCETSLMKVSAS